MKRKRLTKKELVLRLMAEVRRLQIEVERLQGSRLEED